MTALAWFDERCAGVPANLAMRAREAVRAAAGPSAASDAAVTAVLLDAATACMDAALGYGADRAAAADLLAADALLTWACEAAIEEGDGALDALTVETSRRLGALAHDASA
jgi:hypothetical protein